MKLKLNNKTDWSTADLRKLVLAGMKNKGISNLIVDITYAHNQKQKCTGYAYLDSNFLCVRVPKNEIDLKNFAQVFEHEADHTLGLTHKDMQDHWLLRPTWQEGFTLSKKEPALKKAALPLVETRKKHAEKMLAKAETRLKRAKTIRDKWARKAKRYKDL